MNKVFSRSLLATSIAASLVLEVAPALVATGLILKATPAKAQIEEIIVTSRKREESIMQVPTTESVVSTAALENFAIHDIKGVADRVPGLNFSTGPLSSGVLMSLRGIGTASNNPFIDQSIALVADGMQFTQGLAFGAAQFDMSQIEVLKGPQALFFGKAAPAGVISMRSKDPTDQFEATLRGSYEFKTEEKLSELTLSGPVTDTLGLRLATQYKESNGYWKNNAVLPYDPAVAAQTGSGSLGAAAPAHEDSPERGLILKGTAVWNPTDRFNARLKLNYQDDLVQGITSGLQLVACPGGQNSVVGNNGLLQAFIPGAGSVNWVGGAEDCKKDRKIAAIYEDPAFWPGIANGGVPFSKLNQDFGSLELNYDLGNQLTVTSVTGFYDVKNSSMLDVGLTTGFASPLVVQGVFQRHDLTEEARLVSDYDGPVNFITGAFYQKGYSNYAYQVAANQAYSFLGARWEPVALAARINTMDTETKSLFGQVLWKFMPEFELGVGTRWTGETRSNTAINNADVLNGKGPAYEVPLAKPEIWSKTWSPEVSLTYTPSYDLTIFGDIKQAYKSGSYDGASSVAPGGDSSFGDERIRGGELGLKSRMFDEQLAVNATAYFYKYDNMQVEENVFDPNTNVLGVQTTNAASSLIRGIDFDANYAPRQVEGLSMFAAVNWNKARYEKFDNSKCYQGQSIAAGCNLDLVNGVYQAQDLSGKPLNRAPEWTGNLGFSYETPVLDEMTLRFGSIMTFSSSFVAATDAYPLAIQSGYQKTSANIGLVGPKDRWTLELIGSNIFDTLTYGNCAEQPYGDTLVFGSSFAGTGTDLQRANVQMGCFVEQGRLTTLRLTVKLD